MQLLLTIVLMHIQRSARKGVGNPFSGGKGHRFRLSLEVAQAILAVWDGNRVDWLALGAVPRVLEPHIGPKSNSKELSEEEKREIGQCAEAFLKSLGTKSRSGQAFVDSLQLLF